MFKRLLPPALVIFSAVILTNTGCSKLDTTSLGTGLIPAVDNIITKADTLDIQTTQEVLNDSFLVYRTNTNALGKINDPIFGTTQANIYLQPQPPFYPYYLGSAQDVIVKVDSAVLALAYAGAWGDTMQNINLSVYRITDRNWADSPYNQRSTNYKPTINQGDLVGSASIDTKELRKGFKISRGQDSVFNQIRIKLSSAFANDILDSDTSRTSLNNAFRNDTTFRNQFPGLAVVADDGNALMYVNLSDPKTRLELHYVKRTPATNVVDSVFTSFTITPAGGSATASATSNYIKRTYPPAIQNPTPGAEALYLQTSPGTFARLFIPALSTFPNRVIHRAYITVEQLLADPTSDSMFGVPNYMYLDLIDTGTLKYKPLYFDLNLNTRYNPDNVAGFPYFPSNGTIDYSYFGGYARKKTNDAGESVYYYDINITRYLQQLVSKGTPNYSFRLFPGFTVTYPQYATGTAPVSSFPLGNQLAQGRIKVKSGTFPDPKRRMKLVVIYSELN